MIGVHYNRSASAVADESSAHRDRGGVLATEKVLAGSEAAKKSAKTMQQFSEEFAKGMDEWAKSLKAQGKGPFEA